MSNVLCISHEWNLGFEELRALSDAGFRVIPVPNGFEAIKRYAACEIDAVVMNRRLPDIEVSDLVSFFRHHDVDVPIVVLSTVMPLESVPEAVDAVISKHGCAPLLVSTLDVLLAMRAPKPIAAEGDDFAQAA